MPSVNIKTSTTLPPHIILYFHDKTYLVCNSVCRRTYGITLTIALCITVAILVATVIIVTNETARLKTGEDSDVDNSTTSRLQIRATTNEIDRKYVTQKTIGKQRIYNNVINEAACSKIQRNTQVA